MVRASYRELPEGCISDFGFDEWASGELPEERAQGIAEHVGECARCRERVARLRAQDQAFLEKHPAATILRRAKPLAKRAPPEGIQGAGKRWVWRATAAGMAAAAATALLSPALLTRIGTNSTAGSPGVSPPEPAERTKGGAHFGFLIKRGAEVFEGSDGFIAHPGDVVRFSLTTRGPRHVAILSRDGTGSVSEYFPGDGRSREFGAVAGLLVDSSVELDGALGTEELWALFCEEPFTVAPFARELELRARLDTPSECSVDTLTILKRAAP